MDRRFVATALVYAVIGLSLGIHMATSKDHGQLVTHAHIMLLGFVVSFIYALLHRLWLNAGHSRLALVQFYLHQAGTALLVIGLFLLYGGFAAEATLDPLLGLASVTAFAGMLCMAVLFFRSTSAADQAQ